MAAMDKVAFLGLGTMGAAMAANIARAGYPVTVWNRTPDRAPELDDLGVTRAATPAAAVADTPCVVICVSDTPDVEAVLFGQDGARRRAALRGPEGRDGEDVGAGQRRAALGCATAARRAPALEEVIRRGLAKAPDARPTRGGLPDGRARCRCSSRARAAAYEQLSRAFVVSMIRPSATQAAP